MRILIFFILFPLSFRSVAREPDAELLFYSLKVNFTGKKVISEYTCQVRVNNRNGDDYGDIKIEYSSLEKISGLKAEMSDQYGSVRQLKKSEIKNRNASKGAFYQDAYIKEFSLKHNRYPYTITYSYRIIRKQFISLAYWSPVLDLNIPTRRAVLEVSVPFNVEINYYGTLVNDPVVTDIENTRNYKWESHFEGDMKCESYSPSIHNFNMIFPGVMRAGKILATILPD